MRHIQCKYQDFLKAAAILICMALSQCMTAQKKLSLEELTDFKSVGANWHKAADVRADLQVKDSLILINGAGILVNIPTAANHQQLVTNFQHGDVDIELDYMMAKGSNSGIYLQGRYEVQLFDSWDVLNPHSSDNGGIYERWDDLKPEGQKGYDGHAPRLNASRAPGLWQHIKISFQAPRFEGGIKKENAKILKVELNGVLIHENIELSGPTRSSVSNEEVAEDAMVIQGDHGPVAFRNIIVSNYNKIRPSITGITYSIYKGKFMKEPDYIKTKALVQKSIPVITTNINALPDNEFLVRYTGTLHISQEGEYDFIMNISGGSGSLRINNAAVFPFSNTNTKGHIYLVTGDIPFELVYSKYADWARPSLVLNSKGPGIREFSMSEGIIASSDEVDPVLVNATENTILRSFVDIPGSKRIVHAVNVGSPLKIHYTYDMDNGAMVQAWRGNFLDATPMWHSRGDGSSRPAGVVQQLGKPVLAIRKLINAEMAWVDDTTGIGFRTKGYLLDDKDRPTFKYMMYGTAVSDAIRVLENRQGIQREIEIKDAVDNLYVRLAEAATIEEVAKNLYLVNDKSYYLRIEESGGSKPMIREQNGRRELIIPIQHKLSYSILF